MTDELGFATGEMESDYAGAERREAERFPCGLGVRGFTVDDEPDQSWTGRVWDVSATGIGLVLRRRLKRGAVIRLELRPRPGEEPLLVCACVIHTTPQSDGTFRVGCALDDPLSPEDLDALLAANLP